MQLRCFAVCLQCCVPVNRVCRRQDRRPSVEGANNARLGDRNGLLLHRLVEDGTRRIRHLWSRGVSCQHRD